MDQPIDSRQLRAFISLARNENFTLTAKELHLTQSAVSHSMKALEQDLGCRLFDRLGKKAILTQAGEHLLIHAEKILREMIQARTAIEHLENWGTSRLRIGASTTACEYILPQVLSEFKKEQPNCMINIEPGDTPEALEALRENRIDLALILEPKREDQMNFEPLFTDELKFLVAPSHPWAVKGHVTREEISKQNFILYNKKSYTFRMVEKYFKVSNYEMKSVIQFGSMEAIKELVKLGLGVGILAPWIAKEELDAGTMVAFALGSRKLKRNWGIIHWRERRLSMAEETFVSLCRKEVTKLH